MATSYTSLLGLALPVTGELSGTWGDTVNNYITNYLDAAVAGVQIISGSQTAVTLSVTNGSSLVQVGAGATGSAQYGIIRCSGNPASLLTITAPAASKSYLIINATSTSQSVKIVGTGPTTGVTLVSGESAVVVWNGTDFIKVSSSAVDGVSTFSAGTTGFTPSTATSGAVTLAGTLATTNGGTGLTSFTANRVFYSSSTSAIGQSANLTFDGTTLTANALTTTSTVTINGGTANGVAYLNGSKVLTTGSALTFDGSIVSNTGVGFNVNNANALYRFQNGAGTRTGYFQVRADAFDIWSDQAAVPMVFGVANSEAMRLTSTGLGIGTSLPSNKLVVSASGAAGFEVNPNGVASAPALIAYNRSTSAYIQLTNLALQHIWQNSGTEVMRLDSSGNLGLGVTPSAWGLLKALDISSSGSLFGYTAQAGISNNSYFDGSNWRYKNTAAAAFFRANAGAFEWHTAASGTAGNAISFTQAMTLTSGGELLVGTTTSSGDRIYVSGYVRATSGFKLDGSTYIDAPASETMRFVTFGSERARITSGGNLLVGTTSFSFSSNGVQIGADGRIWNTSNIDYNFELAGSTGNRIRFYTSAGGSGATVGSITVSTTATAYNTSSDYRLKDNAQPLTGSGAFIDALQPKTWDWKADGSKGVGFIAHEVQAVSPGSVVGTKDAVDAEGNPVMQAMEYGSAEFIANIVAELQSLRARVAQLESKGA